jgi:hypothetical protein
MLSLSTGWNSLYREWVGSNFNFVPMRRSVFHTGRMMMLFLLLGTMLFTQCAVITHVTRLSKFQNNKVTPVESTNRGRLEYLGSYPVVHLYGTPEEMGRQYGTLLKPQLHSFLAILESVFSEEDMEDYLQLAAATGPFLPGEIQTEIRAIAQASGISYDHLVALNVATKVACSTLAAWDESTPDGRLIMGRNADYRSKGMNKYLGLLVVRHPDKGFQSIHITYLGLVGGFSGMNSRGVSYGNMISYNAKDDTINTQGLPVQIAMRIAGERASSTDEYAHFMLKNHLMVPNIVMVADAEKAVITEHTPFEGRWREGKNGILGSTNFFHNEDISVEYKPDKRYSTLQNEINAHYGNFSVERMKTVMYKIRGRKRRNLQCAVMEPSRMRLHVSINKIPASKGPFKEIDARALFRE